MGAFSVGSMPSSGLLRLDEGGSGETMVKGWASLTQAGSRKKAEILEKYATAVTGRE